MEYLTVDMEVAFCFGSSTCSIPYGIAKWRFLNYVDNGKVFPMVK